MMVHDQGNKGDALCTGCDVETVWNRIQSSRLAVWRPVHAERSSLSDLFFLFTMQLNAGVVRSIVQGQSCINAVG